MGSDDYYTVFTMPKCTRNIFIHGSMQYIRWCLLQVQYGLTLRTENGFHEFISEHYSATKINLFIQTFYFQNVVVPNLRGFRTTINFKHIVGSNGHHCCRSWNCFSCRPPGNQWNCSFFQRKMTPQDYNEIFKIPTSGTASLHQLPFHSIISVFTR